MSAFGMLRLAHVRAIFFLKSRATTHPNVFVHFRA